jgi:hypothetical protein
MKKGLLILGLAAVMLVPMSGSAAVRAGGGRPVVVVGPRFYGGFGGGFGGWYGGPGWPYWGYPYAYGYYAYPNAGEVKLDTKVKDAQVFINGAYAGTTHDNKTMHFRPGTYSIEIREAGRTEFSQQVYVAAGKTLHLHPALP